MVLLPTFFSALVVLKGAGFGIGPVRDLFDTGEELGMS